jgi:hypothetical protein
VDAALRMPEMFDAAKGEDIEIELLLEAIFRKS